MTPLLETQNLYLRIDPRRIHFLKFILEGYDGLAVLSTVDARAGVVLIRFPSQSGAILTELLADLADDLAPTKHNANS